MDKYTSSNPRFNSGGYDPSGPQRASFSDPTQKKMPYSSGGYVSTQPSTSRFTPYVSKSPSRAVQKTTTPNSSGVYRMVRISNPNGAINNGYTTSPKSHVSRRSNTQKSNDVSFFNNTKISRSRSRKKSNIKSIFW